MNDDADDDDDDDDDDPSLTIYLSIYLSIDLPIYTSIRIRTYLQYVKLIPFFAALTKHRPQYTQSIYVSGVLPTAQYLYVSIFLPIYCSTSFYPSIALVCV